MAPKNELVPSSEFAHTSPFLINFLDYTADRSKVKLDRGLFKTEAEKFRFSNNEENQVLQK